MSERIDLSLGFLRRRPASAAAVLERLPPEEVASYLQQVPSSLAAPVVSAMLPFHSARCLMAAGEPCAIALLSSMPGASAAAVLRRMPHALADALIERLPPRSAFRLRLVLRYPQTTVGAWMESGVLTLPVEASVHDAWRLLRQDGEDLERFVYVVDREKHLLGHVTSAALLTASDDMMIERLIDEVTPLKARGDLPLALARRDWPEVDPLPVVARDGVFLGIARYAELQFAQERELGSRPQSVLAETLVDLMETYWSGLARLVEAPFSLSKSAPAARAQIREEKE